ncbi:MAG: XRE family transcriptional regulator [Deltaproteobacteria bacterium]|nr:MAG: XRE family transcriptional regulator [Deltaproteobacteria bacterium]
MSKSRNPGKSAVAKTAGAEPSTRKTRSRGVRGSRDSARRSTEESAVGGETARSSAQRSTRGGAGNNVRALREAQLMSKAELARKAGLSPLTIDRVESGKPCRMDTKRKIILALGYKLSDRHLVFPETREATAAEAPAGLEVGGKGIAEARSAETKKRARSRRRPSTEARRTRDGGEEGSEGGDPKLGGSAA